MSIYALAITKTDDANMDVGILPTYTLKSRCAGEYDKPGKAPRFDLTRVKGFIFPTC